MEYNRSESSIQEEVRQNRIGFTKIIAYSALYFLGIFAICYGLRQCNPETPPKTREPVDKKTLPSRINYESPLQDYLQRHQDKV